MDRLALDSKRNDLRIKALEKDLGRTVEERNRYLSETQRLRREIEALRETLAQRDRSNEEWRP